MESEKTELINESSQQVLESYLEGQIQEYSEMCDTLRTYYGQNLEKIEVCKTDIRIMKSREDSGFALLSPISIESSFQVEISQTLEKQELLEKQNEKYMRDIHFYEKKIQEMEEQLNRARDQVSSNNQTETTTTIVETTPEVNDLSEYFHKESYLSAEASDGETYLCGQYNGNIKEDLDDLYKIIMQTSRFTRVDPRRASVELKKAEDAIKTMQGKITITNMTDNSGSEEKPDINETSREKEKNYNYDNQLNINNEKEPEMHLPHSSYLPKEQTSQKDKVKYESENVQKERSEEDLICVQASDISDVFEEYVNSFSSISAKQTDYYYEDDSDMDVPKYLANNFVITSQKIYKYLLNYANCTYIQFHLRGYNGVLVTLFEWTSENVEKDMEDTVEWYNLRREAVKSGMDVNRNSFENDIIRITVACNVRNNK